MTQTDHIIGSPTSLIEHAADGQNRGGSGSLLGLEPPIASGIEKAGQNSSDLTDLDIQPCYAPLLGTTVASGFVQRRPVSGWFHSIFRQRIARHRPAKSG